MKRYDVEMCYGVGVSVSVEADNREEAIEKAKQMVKQEVTILDGRVDCGDLEFEQVNFVG